MNTKVGLKLCGNCNPEMDAKKLLNKIKSMVAVDFISYEEHGYDVLLMIHGCATACAHCVNNGLEQITVLGLSNGVDRIQDEEELAKKLADEIAVKIQENN